MNPQIDDDIRFISPVFEELWRRLTLEEMPETHIILRITTAYLLTHAALTLLHTASNIASRNRTASLNPLRKLEDALREIEPRYFTNVGALAHDPKCELLERNPASLLAVLDHRQRSGLDPAQRAPQEAASVCFLLSGPRHKSEPLDADDAEEPHLGYQRLSTHSLMIMIRPNLLYCDLKAAIREADLLGLPDWEGFNIRQEVPSIDAVLGELSSCGHARVERRTRG